MSKYKKIYLLLTFIVVILLNLDVNAATYYAYGKKQGEAWPFNSQLVTCFYNGGCFPTVGNLAGVKERITTPHSGLWDANGYYVKFFTLFAPNAANANDAFPTYCTDADKAFPFHDSRTAFTSGSRFINRKGNDGAGVAYIIMHGYKAKANTTGYWNNTTTKTNNPTKNQPWYINYWSTQTAIWWYLAEINNTKILTDAFMNYCKSVYNESEGFQQSTVGGGIWALVRGALVHKNEGTVDSLSLTKEELTNPTNGDFTLDNDGYLYSGYIEASNPNAVINNLTLSIASGTGFEIVNASGSVVTSVANNAKFRVRKLASNVTGSESVKIKVSSAQNNIGNVVSYVSGSSDIQEMAVYEDGNFPTHKYLTLNLTKNGCDLKFKVINNKTNENVCSGTFKIVDMNNQPVSDINGNPIGDIVLSSNNCNPSYQLPNGKYKIKQVVVAQGYYNNSGDVTVDMETSCADEVIIRNEPLCDIKIEIVDKLTNEKICSGSVVVKDSNGNVAKDKDGNEVGRVTLSDTKCGVTLNLPHGNYQVVEETAPTGYIINNETYNINAETTCPDKIIIKNEPLCAIEIDVVDKDTNEKVCQGTLIVKDKDGNIAKDKNGNEVGRVTLSTDNCHVSLDVLKGEYTVFQETASDPYVKDTTIYTVDTKTSCPVNLTIPNDKYYSIKILKKDRSNDSNIKGAKLVLEDIEGNIIKEFTSTSEGVIVDHLLKGTYYLREIEAPKGYKLNEEKMEIEVGHDKDYEVSYYNEEILVPRTAANSFLMVISVIAGTFGISLLLLSKRKKVLVHE